MAIKKGSPLLVILIAVIIVIGISFLPLSRLTGGRIKDFSLFSDILREAEIVKSQAGDENGEEENDMDPELLQAMKESSDGKAKTPRNPITASDSVLSQPIDTIISAPKPSRQGELVVIEDYTTDGVGLAHFRHAVQSGRLARVVVVGDSYIEGDIFTQDLREKLQNT